MVKEDSHLSFIESCSEMTSVAGKVPVYFASLAMQFFLGSLSTDVRESRTATGRRMSPFLAWFCSLPRTRKALVDDCGLTLQTR